MIIHWNSNMMDTRIGHVNVTDVKFPQERRVQCLTDNRTYSLEYNYVQTTPRFAISREMTLCDTYISTIPAKIKSGKIILQ